MIRDRSLPRSVALLAATLACLVAPTRWACAQGETPDPAQFFTDSNVVLLCKAAASGNANVIRDLARVADVNTVGAKGFRPLHFALLGSPEGLKAMFESGAQANIPPASGNSVFDFARRSTHPEEYTLALYSHGAKLTDMCATKRKDLHRSMDWKAIAQAIDRHGSPAGCLLDK